jgi:isopenicillin-N N-acyltransferase like protein
MHSPHFVRLSGSPRKRGRAHGEALKSVIRGVIEKWQTRLETLLAAPFPTYLSRLLAETHFKDAIRKWTPSLLEEINGIAEGCGLDNDLVYAWQLIDEHPWFLEKLAHERAGCSAMGRVGPDTLIGQNWDIPVVKEGVQTLLHITYPDSDLQAFIVTQAGAVGALGMNNRGIGLLCNTLSQLNNSTEGLPVSCLVRGVLEKNTFSESAEFIRNVRHASGQNYLLASPNKLADFECSGNKVVELAEVDQACHANHPLANTDIAQEVVYPASLKRQEYLEKSEYGSAEEMKEVFRNPVVSLEKDASRSQFTAGCAVMELSGSPRLHFAPGPPSITPFSAYSFS